MDVADLAVGDHSSDVCEVVIKAAVEAHLQLDARLLDGGDNCVDLLGGQVNGLLAEDVLACLGSLDSDIGVRVGRGADEHCFDVGVGEHLLIVVINDGDIKLGSDFFGVRSENIGDTDDRSGRHVVGNRLCVKRADAACADDANFELLHFIVPFNKIRVAPFLLILTHILYEFNRIGSNYLEYFSFVAMPPLM